jgi:hypothetical protein
MQSALSIIPMNCPWCFRRALHQRHRYQPQGLPSLCRFDHGGCRAEGFRQVSALPAHVEFPAAAVGYAALRNDASLAIIEHTRLWPEEMHADDSGAAAGLQQFVDRLDAPKKVSPYVEVIFAKEPFSVENGILRPNLKLDRKRIVATYGSKASQPRFESRWLAARDSAAIRRQILSGLWLFRYGDAIVQPRKGYPPFAVISALGTSSRCRSLSIISIARSTARCWMIQEY